MKQKDEYINELKNEINNIKKNVDTFANAYNFNSDSYNNFKKIIDSKIVKYDEISLLEDGIKYKFKKMIKKYEL